MKIQKAKFHFIGVGGIGICGLAELLHNMGASVSGSDLAENANTQRLKELGIQIWNNHQAAHVGDADVVVYSSAIPTNNPEVQEARARKIPLIPRAEALAEIMRLKRGIAIAGTHGKTTTTSLVSSIFYRSALNPTIYIGGRLEMINSTAHLGDGEWLIAEADESDGSFHKLTPEIAIITNIDADHMDHFKSFENLQKAFYEFALKVPFYGVTIVCGDDPEVRILFENFPKRILFYGFDEKNDLFLKGEKGKYSLFQKENIFPAANRKSPTAATKAGNPTSASQAQWLGDFELQLPGTHNALNAAAAAIASLAAGLEMSTVQKGLSAADGVERRFQWKGDGALPSSDKLISVYDDYGHHPTEVRAVLGAFKEKFPHRRLVVYFQPHRYSRTQNCWHDFTTCFSLADELFLSDIYPAGETPLPGITSENLILELKNSTKSHLKSKTNEEKAALILKNLKPGDVFVTLGAGDGWKLGLMVLKKLQGKSS